VHTLQGGVRYQVDVGFMDGKLSFADP